MDVLLFAKDAPHPLWRTDHLEGEVIDVRRKAASGAVSACSSVRRVKNFFADLNERLGQVPFVAGERYSAADITALVTVDFAKALELSHPADHTALKRWYDPASSRASAAA